MPESFELSGTLTGLFLFDVAESIDLGQVHSLLGSTPKREPTFKHPAPEYVRFERPPVTQAMGKREADQVGTVEVRIRYFDYGVASVELQNRFTCLWEHLPSVASKWTMSADLERCAQGWLKEALERTGDALTKQYEAWVAEDYCVVQLDPIRGERGQVVSADELIRDRGAEIAQIVRGELNPLSMSEREDVLRSTMSYYPADLLVVGWVGAFVYDTAEGAETTIDLLEYANTQLLEFRYYDEVLTEVLAAVYKRLEKRHRIWGRWKAAREAEMLNTIRLDYQELVERTDNAIKFLSDMFYARMYKLAANRIGVTDYLRLVNEKLTTARDLYDSMVNEFHQGRAFFLEVTVVIILVVEIVFAFIGKFSFG